MLSCPNCESKDIKLQESVPLLTKRTRKYLFKVWSCKFFCNHCSQEFELDLDDTEREKSLHPSNEIEEDEERQAEELKAEEEREAQEKLKQTERAEQLLQEQNRQQAYKKLVADIESFIQQRKLIKMKNPITNKWN
jgi:hypothetical protein